MVHKEVIEEGMVYRLGACSRAEALHQEGHCEQPGAVDPVSPLVSTLQELPEKNSLRWRTHCGISRWAGLNPRNDLALSPMSSSRPSQEPPKPDHGFRSDPEKAARLLASALDPSPATAPATFWDPPGVEVVAEWFPGYVIEALIGRGSMGAVYRAVHKRLERQVAIKLLPPEVAAREGMAARFEQEARAMAKLSHPNIVALHDFGQTTEDHLYIVMEYVDAADLSRIIHGEQGGMDVPQALAVVGQVCDALQYAHERGFVHRDIKPGNVLVDTEGRVKIADFGLAKLLDAPAADTGTASDPLTMTGRAVGTPDYTAPEQLKGGAIDHRADLYSLGVMFYEMLTGELPRGAWREPSRLVPDASPRLDEVVRRAMQAEPEQRYQQASEVKQAIEETSSATSVASDSTTKPLKRLLAGCMLCLLGIVLGAGFVEWKHASAGRPQPAVVPPVPEPSERALEDMNRLINDLAEAQNMFAHERKTTGLTRYGSGPEQEQRQDYLDELRMKLETAAASGFPAQHPLALEAGKRLGLLEDAHRELKIPEVPAEKCLSPDWRVASGYAGPFTGEEHIPGIRPVSWSENGTGWMYFAAPPATAPVANKDGDLQDFPEFWPLDVPLELPTLPLSSPQTQAEADWIGEQFSRETSADGPGLVLAEFDTEGNPQLSWMYWSRHNDDLIPWAAGHPVASPPGIAQGKLVLRQGVCSVVFDDTPRPRLCGGDHVDASGWAVHSFTWARMGKIARALSGEAPITDLDWPDKMRSLRSKFGDHIARECVAYSPKAAESHKPWRPLEMDLYHFSLAREMLAGTNTGESIPYHRFHDSRVWVTSLVCSRDLAKKIAKRHGARLPVPAGPERLDALARLLPTGLMAHSASVAAEDLGAMPFWKGSRNSGRQAEQAETRKIPEGESLAILRKGAAGVLMTVPARALLVLEWPNSK